MKKTNKYVVKTINDLVDVMDGIDDASFDNFCVDIMYDDRVTGIKAIDVTKNGRTKRIKV